jgi:hypothetical protein
VLKRQPRRPNYHGLAMAFVWDLGDGSGFTPALGPLPFRTRDEASAAWEVVRRPGWTQTQRFKVPAAASYYDGLQTKGAEVVCSRWNISPFPLDDALAALSADRAALAAFRGTRAAGQVADYLDVYARDLDEVERTARTLAAWPSGLIPSHPGHLTAGAGYGHLAETEAP